jgi:hypothetical protein
MDTYEARMVMRDIARESLEIVERMVSSHSPAYAERRRLRELSNEARQALADAGYPGEAVWRAVQRASIAIETSGEQADPVFWNEVSRDLESGVDTLDMLVAPPIGDNVDVHLVG